MKKFKIDLHTHSIVSPDGGLTERQYEHLLRDQILDVIAITDHNRIDFALALHKKIGKEIIVGEEIRTHDGEIIGLFLSENIPSGLSAKATAKAIKKQGGIVLIPHPFETVRSGISERILGNMHDLIDAMEVFNGRSLQPWTRQIACKFVENYHVAPSCNSDSHCLLGIGNTYTLIESMPNEKTLADLLRSGLRREQPAPWLSYFCPTINRLKKCF